MWSKAQIISSIKARLVDNSSEYWQEKCEKSKENHNS